MAKGYGLISKQVISIDDSEDEVLVMSENHRTQSHTDSAIQPQHRHRRKRKQDDDDMDMSDAPSSKRRRAPSGSRLPLQLVEHAAYQQQYQHQYQGQYQHHHPQSHLSHYEQMLANNLHTTDNFQVQLQHALNLSEMDAKRKHELEQERLLKQQQDIEYAHALHQAQQAHQAHQKHVEFNTTAATVVNDSTNSTGHSPANRVALHDQMSGMHNTTIPPLCGEDANTRGVIAASQKSAVDAVDNDDDDEPVEVLEPAELRRRRVVYFERRFSELSSVGTGEHHQQPPTSNPPAQS